MAAPARIGVTGGIGSGKSTVIARFAARGAAIVDTDAIARALTAAGGGAIGALRTAFGSEILDAAGALDRDAMRRRAFADPQVRAALEAVLHPRILQQALDQAARLAARAPAAILFDVPLLVEATAVRAGLQLDRVLVVDCPVPLQRARVLARGGIAPAQADAVIAAQATRAARLALADDVLCNSGSFAALHARVDRLWDGYRAAAGAPSGL